ncbi:MAG: arsenite methyltransferase [Opitutaceae bacterium]|nr:arsenite methyltransferase [Opitutaceae bacterium]
MKDILDPETVRQHVLERYGDIAANSSSCCNQTSSSCCGGEKTYDQQFGYSAGEVASVPEGSNLGLGCGNPTAIASIRPGETILDLGSGAGFDCFLAARQLQGTGQVIGVDMTPAMIAKARDNARKGGYGNVEFRLGEIEALPVRDNTVDLVISNCVINLSPEKRRVFGETFRVLKSGGRLAIADVVATKPLPDAVRNRLNAVGACIGGAALVDEMKHMLDDAGFSRIEITTREETRVLINQWTDDENAGSFVVSAFITAIKP